MRLNLEQPIYLGGRVGQGYTLRKLAYKEAKWRYQSERQSLIFQFLVSLIQYLSFDEQVVVIKESQETQKRFLELTRRRYKKGIARLYELQQAEAELLSFAPRIEQLEKERQVVLRRLQVELDWEEKDIVVKWPESDKEHLASFTPEVLDFAKSQNPDYQRKLLQVERARVQRDFDLGAYRPTLKLKASWGGVSREARKLWQSDSNDWSIALNLKVPLFSRFSSIYTQRIGQENIDFAEKTRYSAEQELELKLKKDFLDYQSSLKRWNQTRKWRYKSRQVLQSGEKSYRLGLVGSFQIHQLQKAKEAASLSFIQARGEMRVARLSYSLTIGEDLYQKYVFPDRKVHEL